MSLARRIILIGGITAGLAGAGFGGWWYFRPPPKSPQPVATTPPSVIHYLASDEFAALDDKARDAYFKKVRQMDEVQLMVAAGTEKLSQHEKDNLGRNTSSLFREVVNERLDAYFKLPRDQRTAFLDKMIDEMQTVRAAVEAARASRGVGAEASPGGSGGGAGGGSGQSANAGAGGGQASAKGAKDPSAPGRGVTPQRLRDMIEKTEPLRRAQYVQFYLAMRGRMQDRGIQTSGPRP